MDQINWLNSIAKVSSVIAEINDLLRNRVSLESGDDSNQNLAEVVWEEEHRWRQNRLQMDADCCNAVLETSGEYVPRVAYQQTENQRKLSLNCPQQISIELDLQTMDKIITPRGIGLAMFFGATAGLVGWLAVFLASRLDLVRLIEKLEAPVIVKADELEDSDQKLVI
tara:strand:- start:47 stop:550 length:504 start_codon:yes stop_codon:yes gene_type:complete